MRYTLLEVNTHNMVKQDRPSKTSSADLVAKPEPPNTSSTGRRAGLGYKFQSTVFLFGYLPQDVHTVAGIIEGRISSKEPLDKYPWHVPPHVALANLPTRDANGVTKMTPEEGLILDTKSAEKFVREYGFLHRKLPSENQLASDWADVIAGESVTDIASVQETLRQAWSLQLLIRGVPFRSDTASLKDFHVFAGDNGELDILTDDLWSFIGVLFTIDDKAGRLGVCSNPDCLAPYFMKKRKSQKFCEAGPCVAYAQRKYALRWWNTEGKKRREKKQTKRRNKKRSDQ